MQLHTSEMTSKTSQQSIFQKFAFTENHEDLATKILERRKTARPKSKKTWNQILFQFPAIGQTLLDVTEKENVKKNRLTKIKPFVDINISNVIEGKRARKPNFKYANATWITEEQNRLSESHTAFHATFMIGTAKSIQSKRFHLFDLPDPFDYWRVMLKHSHANDFKKAAQVEYETLINQNTWKIIEKRENLTLISLKWIFIYKNNSDDYLIKYKIRLIVRDDLQKMNDQNVYAVTLVFKIIKILMVLIIAFGLKTWQLNAINAFLNAENDEVVYCHMSNEYKQHQKILKILKILYDQRKSFLLWLRILIMKCIEIDLYQIFGELCFFTNKNGVFLFFYVDDIVIVYKIDRQQQMKKYIQRIKKAYEIKNLNEIKFFLRIRIIQNLTIDTIILVQNAYMTKLKKEYAININKKISRAPLIEELSSFKNEIDENRMHKYRKMIGSICYFATMIKPNVTKIAFKLIEFFINLDSDHFLTAQHCMQYLYATRFLSIEYSTSKNEEFIIQTIETSKNHFTKSQKKIVFEKTANVSFVNDSDRKSAENYTFKLFDDFVDWATRKQLTMTISIIEVELLILLHANKKVK